MTATAFLLGSNTSMWIPLQVLAPLGDAHSETIATTTQSLGGVTTQHIRAIKRRWTLPQQISGDALMAQLTVLREVYKGPFWLYDGVRPNLLAIDSRMMAGWLDDTGAPVVPSVDLRLTLATGHTVAVESLSSPVLSGLIPVTPSQSLCFGVSAQTAIAGCSLRLGLRCYNAAGGYISTISADIPIPVSSITTTRVSMSGTTPAASAYAEATLLLTAGSALTVTDPAVVPGTADIGPAWRVVIIDDLTKVHHNLLQHSPTLALREV